MTNAAIITIAALCKPRRWSRPESNWNPGLRRPLYYPLYYGTNSFLQPLGLRRKDCKIRQFPLFSRDLLIKARGLVLLLLRRRLVPKRFIIRRAASHTDYAPIMQRKGFKTIHQHRSGNTRENATYNAPMRNDGDRPIRNWPICPTSSLAFLSCSPTEPTPGAWVACRS